MIRITNDTIETYFTYLWLTWHSLVSCPALRSRYPNGFSIGRVLSHPFSLLAFALNTNKTNPFSSSNETRIIQSCNKLDSSQCGTWAKTSPLNSQKWLTWNFSLQYPYIIQQRANENTQTYHVEVVVLI